MGGIAVVACHIKIPALALTLVMVLSLTACGNGSSDSNQIPNSSTLVEVPPTPTPVLLPPEATTVTSTPSPSPSPSPEVAVLLFAGDINLDDTWSTMRFLEKQENGLSDCISQPLLEIMRAADVFLLNNEFAFSDRGTPMENKAYTFRAKTENVKYLIEMGVDIVSLANNHVFDYGADAFYDTLDTLNDAGIKYVGAGRDINEAMEAEYITINGITIAYVAASRAEKNIMTPQAGENSPGILRTYDHTLFLEAVRSARIDADFVVAYVHWGTEYSYILEEAQTGLARELIDNGADIVIGAHPHCLQGIEYYNGKPIIYSLGNLWFNDKTLDTALLEVTVNSSGDLSIEIIPCLQKDLKTILLTDEQERKRVLELIESISP
jgi:poly-gamma-glutamate synthesis protein (capsule biosynthesis protein)